MKRFIIINGPMGVGKTTVGKIICDKLGRAAFIDGDWCLDIHPFVGNKETKAMAIDNIIHMTRNYFYCSESDTVVLSWIMSEQNTEKIISGVSDLDFQICDIVLTCGKEVLVDRWKKDTISEWRSDEKWFTQSINSLDNFSKLNGTHIIDTSALSADMVAEIIIKKLKD